MLCGVLVADAERRGLESVNHGREWTAAESGFRESSGVPLVFKSVRRRIGLTENKNVYSIWQLSMADPTSLCLQKFSGSKTMRLILMVPTWLGVLDVGWMTTKDCFSL